jgi:hypothetical protein
VLVFRPSLPSTPCRKLVMTCCGEALLPVVPVVATPVPELVAAPLVAEALDDVLGDSASPKAPPPAVDVAVAWNVLLVYVRFRLIPAISLGSTLRLAAAAKASTASPEKNCEASAST